MLSDPLVTKLFGTLQVKGKFDQVDQTIHRNVEEFLAEGKL